MMQISASELATAVGLALVGIVAVLAICAVFYVIGRGEDRDRADADTDADIAADEAADACADPDAGAPGAVGEAPPPQSPDECAAAPAGTRPPRPASARRRRRR